LRFVLAESATRSECKNRSGPGFPLTAQPANQKDIAVLLRLQSAKKEGAADRARTRRGGVGKADANTGQPF